MRGWGASRVAELAPLQARYAELRANPDHLRALLTRSADAIRPIARKTYADAKLAMGVGLASAEDRWPPAYLKGADGEEHPSIN